MFVIQGTKDTQAVPSPNELISLMAAIEGGNAEMPTHFLRLFPTTCPQPLLDHLLAIALLHHQETVSDFLIARGANNAAAVSTLTQLRRQTMHARTHH